MTPIPRGLAIASAIAVTALAPMLAAAPANAVQLQQYSYSTTYPEDTWINSVNVAANGTVMIGANHFIDQVDPANPSVTLEFDVTSSSSPSGVVRDAAGDFYVVSYWLGGRIEKYDAGGNDAGTIVPQATSCTGPTGGALAMAGGDLFRLNLCTGTIDRFSTSGQSLGGFATVGSPTGLATDRAGHLLVTSTGQAGATEYDTSGNVIRRVAASSSGTAQGVAVDGLGNVYLASGGTVTKYDASGAPLTSFSARIIGNGLQEPIAVSPDGSKVYLVDIYTPGVLVYAASTTTLTAPLVTATATKHTVTATWTAPANLSGGQQVSSYRVRIRPTGTTAWSAPVTVDGSTLTATFASGSPIAISPSTGYDVEVVAIDAQGDSAAGTASTTTLALQPPVITTASLPSGTVGAAYSQTVSATSFAAVAYGLNGTLPTGLSLNAGTGVISGTPTAKGTFSFAITATNEDGTVSRDYSVAVGSVALVSTGGTVATAAAVAPDGIGIWIALLSLGLIAGAAAALLRIATARSGR